MAKKSEPSQRQLRVGEVLRHALSSIFARGETNDPELEEIGVTVLEVSMSPDLKQGLVFVRPLQLNKEKELLAAIKRNRKYIRILMVPHISLKFMPDIRFKIDTAPDHAQRIDHLLTQPKVKRDLATGRDETQEEN